jgi:hypothetical protein
VHSAPRPLAVARKTKFYKSKFIEVTVALGILILLCAFAKLRKGTCSRRDSNPAIPASDRPQTLALDRSAIGLGPSGIEPATFRLLAQCINQVRHSVPPPPHHHTHTNKRHVSTTVYRAFVLYCSAAGAVLLKTFYSGRGTGGGGGGGGVSNRMHTPPLRFLIYKT